ncbi:MAG TPA: DUF5009 domain-containing protein [bacterium]|nr:DUF5009 domain-containing protein [bacterium]
MAAPISFVSSNRIRSIDVTRGLIVLVMLFVNDLAGVTGAPGWMKHISPSTADGYTFVDLVFPAFLFIVGLSLPIALEKRLGRGESKIRIAGHILIRTLSLLLMGVLMVNTESIAGKGHIDPRLWQVLFYGSAIMIWLASGAERKRIVWARRIIGIVILAALAIAYRGEGGAGLRPHWWGILGLIGWSYLVTALLYLVIRRRTAAFAAAIILLYLLYFADRTGLLAFLAPFNTWIGISSVLGSQPAITASGALLSIMLFSVDKPHAARLRIILLFALVLGTIAVLLHSLSDLSPLFIYNKNAATPPWCLISSAWTALLFALIYWLIDRLGLTTGTGMLATAGQNALFAFILGPIFYLLIGMLPLMADGRNLYAALGAGFATGLWRSLLVAFAGTWLTAWMQRSGRYLRI